MNTFVAVIPIEDGAVERLVGPFESSGAAMDWIDQESKRELADNPEFQLESTDEIVMVASDDEEDPEGVIFQVVQSEQPGVETVEAEPVED